MTAHIGPTQTSYRSSRCIPLHRVSPHIPTMESLHRSNEGAWWLPSHDDANASPPVHAADESRAHGTLRLPFLHQTEKGCRRDIILPLHFEGSILLEIVTGNLTLLRQEAPSMINQCKPNIPVDLIKHSLVVGGALTSAFQGLHQRGYVIEMKRKRVGIGRRPRRQTHDT